MPHPSITPSITQIAKDLIATQANKMNAEPAFISTVQEFKKKTDHLFLMLTDREEDLLKRAYEILRNS